MTLAIEPMFNLGTARVSLGSDGWTVRTADGKPSAHFEHTVVATADGPVVLGFGRYSADGLVTGVPDETEYPVPAAPPRREPAVTRAKPGSEEERVSRRRCRRKTPSR